jgi:hypothetical protein
MRTVVRNRPPRHSCRSAFPWFIQGVSALFPHSQPGQRYAAYISPLYPKRFFDGIKNDVVLRGSLVSPQFTMRCSLRVQFLCLLLQVTLSVPLAIQETISSFPNVTYDFVIVGGALTILPARFQKIDFRHSFSLEHDRRHRRRGPRQPPHGKSSMERPRHRSRAFVSLTAD